MRQELWDKIRQWMENGCPEDEIKISIKMNKENGCLDVIYDEKAALLLPIMDEITEFKEMNYFAMVKLLSCQDKEQRKEFFDMLDNDVESFQSFLYESDGVDFVKLANLLSSNSKVSS